MTTMLEKYLPREEFESYEDFRENFRIRVPYHFHFAYDVVDEYARLEPGKVALQWRDPDGAQATFTFAQLKEESDRAARYFQGFGIGKGDPVMLILKRRYEFWFCLLGLHKLGAVAIPATHLLRPKDIIYRAEAADITTVVAVGDPAVLDHVDEAAAVVPALKHRIVVGGTRDGWHDYHAESAALPAEFPRPTGAQAVSNDDPLLLYFTSGTTAHPKMVRHNVTYPLGHIVTARYWQNVRPGGLHFTVSDTGWAKSMWGKIYGQWIAGCAVFVYDYDKFVPGEMLRVIAENGVTSFCAPPTVYRYLIREDLAAYDLSQLQEATIAGEPLNPEVYHQFLRLTGLKMREGYGQTECTLAIATFPWMEPRPGSMGKPSPGYEADVIDEDGRSCPAGEVGEIVFRTDVRRPMGIFDGYYRYDELTRKMWHDDVYHTGDTAWRDADGYFWFVGRVDDLIKSSGYRIGPFEVESALLEHPAVVDCAVTAVPDPLRGHVVKATVILAAGYDPCQALVAELQEHVKNVTAPYKYPRIVEFAADLPKTISGKIRRVEIRQRTHAGPPDGPVRPA